MKGGDGDVFSAVDVARFCGVDLKTIHHWAARGKLRHRKTDGGHVRVERTDLVAFLRAYSFPLPDALRRGKPRVFVVAADERARVALVRALARRFEVEAFTDAVDAIVAVGSRAPQAVAAVTPLAGVDLAHAIARLRDVEPTGHVRVVVVTSAADDVRWIDAGAAAVIPADAPPSKVRDALAQATGVG
jgi:excisionase family DNA binding protein